MRPLEQWDESDLLALITNGVQESLSLDYKRSDALSKLDKKKASLWRKRTSADDYVPHGITADEASASSSPENDVLSSFTRTMEAIIGARPGEVSRK